MTRDGYHVITGDAQYPVPSWTTLATSQSPHDVRPQHHCCCANRRRSPAGPHSPPHTAKHFTKRVGRKVSLISHRVVSYAGWGKWGRPAGLLPQLAWWWWCQCLAPCGDWQVPSPERGGYWATTIPVVLWFIFVSSGYKCKVPVISHDILCYRSTVGVG